MNPVTLKKSLDNLFSKINPPYDVTPEWCNNGLSTREMEEIQKILGPLPEDIQKIHQIFSGLHHECPYFLWNKAEEIKKQLQNPQAI